jgi:hypothetical protein
MNLLWPGICFPCLSGTMRSPVLFGERVSVMTPFLSTTNRACGVFVLSGARAGGRPDCEFWLVFGPAGAGFPPRRAPRANGTAPNLTAIIGGSTRLLLSQLEARELGRVDLGGLPPRPPTDPDVPVKGIRLVTLWRCPSHDPLPCGNTLGGSMPSACFRRWTHNAAPPSLHGVR